MKKKRLSFVKAYRSWTSEDWGKVLFSDESLEQQFSIRVQHVWRPSEERYHEQSWASPQIRHCGLTKKVADMRTCGFWQFKLRTCGFGLFLIFIRNSASFIQILKSLSIFAKYLCFYPVKHDD